MVEKVPHLKNSNLLASLGKLVCGAKADGAAADYDDVVGVVGKSSRGMPATTHLGS